MLSYEILVIICIKINPMTWTKELEEETRFNTTNIYFVDNLCLKSYLMPIYVYLVILDMYLTLFSKKAEMQDVHIYTAYNVNGF